MIRGMIFLMNIINRGGEEEIGRVGEEEIRRKYLDIEIPSLEGPDSYREGWVLLFILSINYLNHKNLVPVQIQPVFY